MPELYLKVDSAYPEDLGGGKARLDPETMLALRVSPGDLIKVEGKKETLAKVWRAMAKDWDQQKIRIDKFTRENAAVTIGDRVKISKVEAVIEAKEVVIAPPENLPPHLTIHMEHAAQGLINYPVSTGDVVPIRAMMIPQLIEFKVISLEPEDAVIITRNTTITVSDKPAPGFEGLKRISYEDIGGLKDELQRLRETIELPIRHPELFKTLGIEPPKGVLLYGPPGTGKTLIARAVANESGANFISIAGPEVISKYYGESEQRLREVFEEANENAPSIIFIDELDSIAPKREDVTGEVERRVVAQLLTMMDGLEERGQVVVIGATNRLDAIDPALRRPGRFDREIEIGVPPHADRQEILNIHTRGMPIDEGVRIDLIASRTHGFVGADLAALAREAAIRALRRYLPEIDLEQDSIPQEVLDNLRVTSDDFREAQREVFPSAMREVMLEGTNITWSDVGGLAAARQEIREAVELPLTGREKFEELGITSPKGILLYGPPGTGKTLIAKAVATESGANFIPIKGPQLLSKWVGESERAVREIFKKARQVAPSIILFDEMDALTPARGGGDSSHTIESVLNQILTEIDGIEDIRDVIVMGATNRPDIVDPALLRPGRFDRLVYIGEPDEEDRKKILWIHMRSMPIEEGTIEEFISLLEGCEYSCIEKIFGSIGEGKEITVDAIREAASGMPKKEGVGLKRSEIRKLIHDLILRFNQQYPDPARDMIIQTVAARTAGYVGSDLEGLCREAGMLAMREGVTVVSTRHFEAAMEKVRPTMNERLIEYYSRIQQHFKGGLPRQSQPVEYQ